MHEKLSASGVETISNIVELIWLVSSLYGLSEKLIENMKRAVLASFGIIT